MTRTVSMAVLAGIGLLTASCGSPGQTNPEDKRSARAHTEIIHASTLSEEFQAPGTVHARTSTVLSSKIVGQISSLTVHEGDRVHLGQVIAEIDNREAAIQVRRARAGAVEAQRAIEEADRGVEAADRAVRASEANRQLASSTLKRYDLLRERHSISAQEYDEIETRFKAAQLETERAQEALGAAKARGQQIAARIEQAQAEVDAAEVMLGYARIASPIDGIVTVRHADPGMLATPGMPLLTIEDDRTYELDVLIEESRAAKVTIGQCVRIEIDALEGTTIDGRVREISPSSDPGTRTYTAKVQITTPLPHDRTLRSGFFARTFFADGERKALVIPESALVYRGQLEGVYIVGNNTALLRLVKTGKRYDQRVEIISGLAEGMRIVTAPTPEISDGVNITEAGSSRNTP